MNQFIEWGFDICILSHASNSYLPGIYALFNSAISNGFKGEFKVIISDDLDPANIPAHPQLSIITYTDEKDLYFVVSRMSTILSLASGNYLWLGADFIIERPCGDILKSLQEGIIVSTEPEPKYDVYDVFFYSQCKELGLPLNLPPYPYVNADFLAFSLPRDKSLLENYVYFSQAHLKGITKVCEHPCFQFVEQDILNLVIRKGIQDGCNVFSISSKNIEFSSFSTYMQDRPFPFTDQKYFLPPDRIKYFIHGAALRRPWLKPSKSSSIKKSVINFLEPYGVGAWYRKPKPYERAWAYYACSEDMPIPVSAWAEKHSFTSHKNWLWRKAHGLLG